MNAEFVNPRWRPRPDQFISWTLVLIAGMISGITLGLRRNACAGRVVQSVATVSFTADLQSEVETERLAITGRVLDPQGAPIEQAYVCLGVSRSHEITWEGPTILAEAQTGQEGDFQLTPLKRDVERYLTSQRSSFELWVHKPGWTVGMHQTLRTPPDRPADLRLEPEAPFEISVRDTGGKPCAAATITPTSCTFADDVYLGVPRTILPRITTVTDENGKARLTGLRLEQIRRLRISHPATGTQDYNSRQGLPIATDLKLMPVGSLEGRLLVPDGVAVDLTKVQLRMVTLDPQLNDPDEAWYGMAEVVPDRDGRFRVPQIVAGTIRIFVTEPDEFPVRANPSPDPTIIRAGMTAELSIPLERAIPVTQSLVDAETGAPLGNVAVSFQHQHLDTWTRTNDEGIVSVRLLPGVEYHRFVDLPGEYIRPGGSSVGQNEIIIPQDATEFELEPEQFRLGRRIDGMVLDAAGNPFPGALVTATVASSGFRNGARPELAQDMKFYAQTGANGWFSFTGIEPRVDIVVAVSLGAIELADSVRVAADDRRDVIVRAKAFDFTSLNGRIVDTEGRPVEGAKVYIQTDRNGRTQSVCRVYSRFDGSFETPAHLLKGDDYQIQVATNKEDKSSEWYMLTEPNQTLPDFVVDRQKLGIRAYIDRSAVQK